ncbi:bifunctional 23S rRNA (guanine(2069)-N(7))-methyltransferase RlmK/23S rRNA (guanine(2445)-N(2))-methyltransferase RlmL [Deltaproteobacteria bacterium TL4]
MPEFRNFSLFVTTPKGLEAILQEELKLLGITRSRRLTAGVQFKGTLEDAYKVCLWSRTANRVLLNIASFQAPTPETLYEGIMAVNWSEHLAPDGSLAVSVNTLDSAVKHTQYAAQKVKDAIVDQFRQKLGQRPNVDLEHPHLRVNVYLLHDRAQVSLDLSGESLHRRHYRVEEVAAPLKENLAAALLIESGWLQKCQAGIGLMDPMCGSGTFLIEAAHMAGDRAPGLGRPYFAFLHWQQHDAALWGRLVQEAQERAEAGKRQMPPIVGYDADTHAIRACWANLERAQLHKIIHVEKKAISEITTHPAFKQQPGLLIVNPPYGERLGEIRQLEKLYAQLGKSLSNQFPQWTAAILSGNPRLLSKVGLRYDFKTDFFNGALPCELRVYEVPALKAVLPATQTDAPDPEVEERPLSHFSASVPTSGTIQEQEFDKAEMFGNRLQKNLKKVRKWAKREGIQCYRVYDSDLPEYAVAIDLYGDWAHVQEYAPPVTIDQEKAVARLKAIMHTLPAILQLPQKHIVLKQRQRQKGNAQYEKRQDSGQFLEIQENGLNFLVNLQDYLDTGLFLDHRITRKMLKDEAKDKRFLNLFGYTGTATVYAAKGGAYSTTTVDLSNTYLDWAQKNMKLNYLTGKQHRFIQADCLKWIKAEKEKYDLIFLDPPTFSNSAKMQDILDIQRDHVVLIHDTLQLLDPGGILVFSTNRHHFHLQQESFQQWNVENITSQTVSFDFERTPRIHHCWKFQ